LTEKTSETLRFDHTMPNFGCMRVLLLGKICLEKELTRILGKWKYWERLLVFEYI